MLRGLSSDQRSGWPARWLLLAAFPAALAVSLALQPEPQLERALLPLPIGVAVVALGAYLAVALLALQPARNAAEAQSYPLGDGPVPDVGGGHPRPLLRWWVTALMLLGAFAIAVVAPALPDFTGVEQAWGDAASAGAVLSAVVAAALAVSVVGVFLGSMLRRADAEPPPSAAEARLRIGMLLFVSLLGAVVYYTISP